MKNRITTALAVTITALGLASLPTLASAGDHRQKDGVFNSFPNHGGDRHDRHDNDRRDHNQRGGYRDRYDDNHYHGTDRHRQQHGHKKHHDRGHHYGHRKHHNHGHHYGHGPQHGYYRQSHDHHYGHGSHIGVSGYYVDPLLGIKVVIH